MPKLEPTYLRYVYDGLNKGSLNAENASALPQGFIGLYEQEFTQKTPANKRREVLYQLALWSLFKGPVTANLAAAILEIDEEQIKNLIDRYSSWFNSPESGKYQLYHERLRVYLLQKLKTEEVQALNEKLITFLEDAVTKAEGEEDEYYALEYLHQHMALESQLGNQYERLHSYVNQESLWSRQIQLSKGYAWSQDAVQQGIKEGARRNHEMNTIRSTVNSVMLMTQEQNSAEDILNLLNEGDYLAALKRAESWVGERQFKLYLLFIHELTIGTSKEANFRKEACKAVLEAIDQTPEDHSVLDWCKFYPELAVYKYHEELLKMELDGIVIWKRGTYSLRGIIGRKDVNNDILKNLASEMTDSIDDMLEVEDMFWDLNKAYREISKAFINQGNIEESLKVASDISDNYDKSLAYSDISRILMEQGKKEESLKVISWISNAMEKSNAYKEISKVLMEQGKNEESFKVISWITDAREKSNAYTEISKVLIRQGKSEESKKAIKKSLLEALKINDLKERDINYALIAEILIDNYQTEDSYSIIEKIEDNLIKLNTYADSAYKLIVQGNIKESYKFLSFVSNQDILEKLEIRILKYKLSKGETETLRKLTDLAKNNKGLKNKFDVYLEICHILYDNVDRNKSFEILDQFLKFIDNYDFDSSLESIFIKEEIYLEIIKYLIEKNIYNKSIQLALKLKDPVSDNISLTNYKSLAFKLILESLIKSRKTKQLKYITLNSLSFKNQISNIYSSLIFNKDIIKNLIGLNQLTKVKDIIGKESDSFNKLVLGLNAAINLSRAGNNKDSQKMFSLATKNNLEINDVIKKTQAYIDICKALIENKKNKMAFEYIEKSLLIAFKIKSNFHLNQKLTSICKLLIHLNDVKKSEQIINEFISESYQDKALSEICIVCDKLGLVKDSRKIFSKIKSNLYKSVTLKAISKNLLELGFHDKAVSVINGIQDDFFKAKALIEYCNFITQKNEAINVDHIILESFGLAENLERILSRNQFYLGIDLSFNTTIYERCYELINGKNYKKKFIEGISKKIKLSNELNYDVNPYLYKYNDQTQNLSNILFYQAKMACFFEENRNEEKLDMLSEVLDIKDWRRISESA